MYFLNDTVQPYCSHALQSPLYTRGVFGYLEYRDSFFFKKWPIYMYKNGTFNYS
jgi:hypothetical protein